MLTLTKILVFKNFFHQAYAWLMRYRSVASSFSYETIRYWAKRLAPDSAGRLRRKPASPGDVWHLHEVVVTIGGKKHWNWRAADQDGYVLDEIVRPAETPGRPKRPILGSYGTARRQIMPTVEHRSHEGLNNRAENPHLPLQERERLMLRFRSRKCPFNDPKSFRAASIETLHYRITSRRSRIGRP